MAAALAASFAAGCGGAPPPAAKKAGAADEVAVVLAPAVQKTVQRGIDVYGTIWADEDATIATKVSGKVAAIYKDVGDPVRSGEPLLQIVPTDYALAKREREMGVLEALAKIGLTAIPGDDFDPANVPTVRRAKLQAENAQARFARGKRLFEQQPPRISEQDYEDLKTTSEVAVSNYEVEVLTARALVSESRTRKAELDAAVQRLTDSTVRAPAADSAARAEAVVGPGNGSTTQPAKVREYVVAKRLVSVGEFARDGSPVFRLVDESILKLRASVPERYSNDVAIGQTVSANVEASAAPITGLVTRINPQVDPANRTFEIEVTIPNPKHTVKPGSYGRGRVLTRQDPSVVFIPQEAVISFAGVDKVFLVDESSAAKEVVVTLGERSAGQVEVIKGLTGKESVVVAGNSKLAMGVKVVVKQADPAATAPADSMSAEAGQ